MLADIVSSLGMLLGSTGIFLYLIKLQNTKLTELEDKKLDKEMFKEHLKTFDELKSEVKDVRKDMGDIRKSINQNTELLIRVDERIARMQ
jgi:hypothetical protein